jgi:hypothetical protein
MKNQYLWIGVFIVCFAVSIILNLHSFSQMIQIEKANIDILTSLSDEIENCPYQTKDEAHPSGDNI